MNDGITVSRFLGLVCTAFVSILLVILTIWGLAAAGRVYDVWAQHKEGEAELAKATANRQIAIQ